MSSSYSWTDNAMKLGNPCDPSLADDNLMNLKDRCDTLDSNLSTVTDDLDNLTSTVSTQEISISELNNLTEEHTSAIATNSDSINTLGTNLSDEIDARETAIQDLQAQIDDISSSDSVIVVVLATYADLENYDVSGLSTGDVVKVLEDETHDNMPSYYKYDAETNAFTYIGSTLGITASEAANLYVPKTRTINNKALTTNINLTASDVGAIATSALGDATITFSIDGEDIGSFTTNQNTNQVLSLPVAKNLTQPYVLLDSGIITLVESKVIYVSLPNSSINYSFNSTGISSFSKAITFELAILLSSVQAVSFPSNITWQDNVVPEISDTGLYLFAFRTFDGGINWIGNLQGLWTYSGTIS